MAETRHPIARQIVVACALLIVGKLSAANDGGSVTPSVLITESGDKDSALRLEARAAPLGRILNEISRKTGAVIHYSVLPEAPVTATCAGANVGQIMDCIAAKQIGLVGHKAQKDKPAEFWLLGSSVGSCQATTFNREPIPQHDDKADLPDAIVEKIDKALQKLKSQNPGERERAIAELIRIGQSKDTRIAQAVKTGMLDPDARVRVKTVSTLAREEGEYGATETLQKALEDTDASVRLQAVDSIRENVEMLQQATNDADELVRSLAQTKLAAINNKKFKAKD